MAKVSLRAYNHEIEAMIDRGHLDEAIAHCKHILKTFPKHLETYRLLGKAYLEYKRYPEAADIFSRVLVSTPSDFVANVGMSIIRDEENHLDDAIWHMERAFETQPSNAAIQSEMQRLYGRRDGVQPPRIRMTRGALAHMYVQGELYPQAISEIKSVLKEDSGRTDMQVLLARAYYRSGLKNDAAEVASAVLRTNPYNLDANRVLLEILSVDHPENVPAYRQRVVELDPYAAQVTSSVFLSNEVPDAAVTLEHLDWNGQPVGLQPDWQARQAISLESAPQQDEQPDWLKSALGEAPSASQASPFDQAQGTHVPAFDAAAPSAAPVEPVDDIPDFLRAAGWGQSTGAFDESKPAFAESEPSSAGPAIEQGDLPDWVKAMAPQQPAETPAEEDELPDWINKIGTSALPVSSEASDQPDWMQHLDEPAPPTAQPAAGDQPDWLNQFGAPEGSASTAPEEQPDWLKGFANEAESAPSSEAAEDLDWLGQLGQTEGSESKAFEASADEFEFLKKPVEPLDAAPSASAASDAFDFLGEPAAQSETESVSDSSDDFDFLNPLGSQPTPGTTPSEDFDFLNELTKESEQVTPATTSEAAAAGPLGTSEEEQDDSFAWLESLAAKQGATEGLLTKPEERLEEEPDWVKRAKDMEVRAGEPPVEGEQPPVAEPAGTLEELGKSEQDDSFAWLESLAAKQGDTEGSLTQPEESLEKEPEWVQQDKNLGSRYEEPPTEPTRGEKTSAAEPVANVQDLGKSEQERDDSFAWLESLAAKQGASEGLLTKPEERPAEEPEWVKQAKDIGEPAMLTPAAEQEEPASADDTAAWLRSLDEGTAEPQAGLEERPEWMAEATGAEEPAPTTPMAEEFASIDDTAVWLKGLDEEASASQPEERPEEKPEWMAREEAIPAEEHPLETPVAEQPAPMEETATWLQSLDEDESTLETSSHDQTAIWLKGLDQGKVAPPQPAETPQAEDLPAWMQEIEGEEAPAEEPAVPATSLEATEGAEWIGSLEEEKEPVTPEVPKVDTGSLPSWLRGLEEEETRQSAFGSQEDLPAWLRDETGEVVAEPAKIEPTRATDWQPAEARQPEAERPEPEPEPVAPPKPEPELVDVIAIIEEKLVEQEPEKPAPPKPRKEPAPRKVTGTLGDPVLGQARSELSRSNISGALDNYGRLIKKGRFLEDIIYDLRDASYRYPVDVSIWQSLGDAYMRANRLQDALDAYTKAEELLR